MCWTNARGLGGDAHNGPDLLTWHRALLLEFEHALNAVSDRPVAIPYWDWTNPASTRAMLRADFMGTTGRAKDGYVVTNGPFRKGQWRIRVKGPTVTNPAQSDWIVRAVGGSSLAPTPPTTTDVRRALARPAYDVAPFGVLSDARQSFVAYLGGATKPTGITCTKGVRDVQGATGVRLHAQAHAYIGGSDAEGNPGTLTDTVASPNDPVFWLLHANVDRLAEAWWAAHDHEYLPRADGPQGANAGDTLWPFSVTNADMARPAETLGYTYVAPATSTATVALAQSPAWICRLTAVAA